MTQKEVEFYFNKFVVDDIMGRLDEAEERIRKTKETLKKLLEMQGHINIKEDNGTACPECNSPFPGKIQCPKCGPVKQGSKESEDEFRQ